MKFIKNALFLLLCLAVGFGIAKAFLYIKANWGNQDFSHREPTLVTGVGDAPARRGFLLSVVPPEDTWPVMFEQWHKNWASTIAVRYGTAPLEPLVKAAHAHGLSVVLLPPARYVSQNPYPKPLPQVAAEAAQARVDVFCLSWLASDPDPAYWREQSAAVRARFKGKLILAARWDILPAVSCWDAADYIGVTDPTFAPRLPHASDHVRMDDFRVSWGATIGAVEAIAKHHGKQAAILGVEVPDNPRFKLPLPGTSPHDMPVNRPLQAMIYEALLVETKGRAASTDILLLSWGDLRTGVNHVPGLSQQIEAAWDPKKPRPAETFPAALGDPFDDAATEADPKE